MAPTPDITLYFLGASRAIRIAWLLEELKVPYKIVSSARASNNLAPPEFRAKIPSPLGKSPTLQDGELVIQESGAICEYLCETYDSTNSFIPKAVAPRAKVRELMAAAEGTFMIHALPILYNRLRMPEAAKQDGTLDKLEEALSANVHNDLDWLEKELGASKSKYLVGDTLTAADIMIAFSVQFILKRELGVKGEANAGKWKIVRDWIASMEDEAGYKRAVEKTGFQL